jgi:hypothetical protein
MGAESKGLKKSMMALIATVAMLFCFAGAASAQTSQEGLVNVNLENIDIAVPVSVAANICDVKVNALADVIGTGNTACIADAESGATFGPGGSDRSPQQSGLVNVNVSDVNVFVPVSVAANICDVEVNVLAQSRQRGQTTCEAVAQSEVL